VPSSLITAFQPNAFQNNAFQINGRSRGYAQVSIVEIRPVYANVVIEEPNLVLANVSIIETKG